MTNLKHQNFPQMKAYDEMPPGEVTPFAMLKGPSNFASKEINTDQEGFRFSSFDGKEKSFCNFDTSEFLNIIIGGSTAFGVGSSSDELTLSSMLMKNLLYLRRVTAQIHPPDLGLHRRILTVDARSYP